MKAVRLNVIGEGEDLLDFTEEKPKEPLKIEQLEETNKTPDRQQMTTVPVELLKELVALAKEKREGGSSNDRLADAIEKLAASNEEAAHTEDRRFLGTRPIDIIDIDEEDILEIPAVFFARSISYAIYDDKRKGHTVKTPYKRAFKFKAIERSVSKTSSRTPAYLSLSAIIIHSKKEAEWLRAHTLLGIYFFEKRADIEDVDLEYQDFVIKAWQICSAMDDSEILQRCTASGIKIDTDDISQMKKRLARVLAKNMSKDDKAARRNPIKDLENFATGKLPSPDEFQQQTIQY